MIIVVTGAKAKSKPAKLIKYIVEEKINNLKVK